MSDQSTDPEIILRLPLSAVRTIMQHLGMGAFNTVVHVVNAIYEQAEPQMKLAAAAIPSTATSEDAERLN